jgi:hypothetical protein
MSLFATPFNLISLNDLQRLIDNGVTESRQLDYKQDAIGNTDNDKKEFLKDISAFANAQGGDLIIGMAAQDGVPVAPIAGVDTLDADAEIQRLENIIRDSIEPRLIGYGIRSIALANGNHVLIVRVPRSWNPPHRLNFKGTTKFFTRNSNGVHEVDVDELRALFVGGAELSRRIADFRASRLKKLTIGDAPVQNLDRGKLVLHVVPMATFGQELTLDVKRARQLAGAFLPIHNDGGMKPEINFDGLLVSSCAGEDHQWKSYTQVFRDGCIESVGSEYLWTEDAQTFLRHKWVGRHVFEGLPRFLTALAELQITPPYVVMVTLQDVLGSYMRFDNLVRKGPVDRDSLATAPTLIQTEELEGEWHQVLRPALTAIWNAYGLETMPGFNADGHWRPGPA